MAVTEGANFGGQRWVKGKGATTDVLLCLTKIWLVTAAAEKLTRYCSPLCAKWPYKFQAETGPLCTENECARTVKVGCFRL